MLMHTSPRVVSQDPVPIVCRHQLGRGGGEKIDSFRYMEACLCWFIEKTNLLPHICSKKYCHNNSHKFAFEELPKLELLQKMGWFKKN